MIKEKIFRKVSNKYLKRIFYTTILVLAFMLLFFQANIHSTKLASNSSKFLSKLDLNIQEVKIEGTKNTDGSDIVSALNLSKDTPLVKFNLQDANNRISRLDWVKDVEIKKLYPSTLKIKIYEYEPIAIWIYDGSKFVIDQDGQIIKGLDPNKFKNLKFVAGYNALDYIPSIIKSLGEYPGFDDRVKSILRVGDRRWTVRLFNGLEIYFPETGMSKAIEILQNLDNETQLLSRYIDVIDMRLPNRMDIMPSIDIKRKSI
ncbi:MAG: hypothetical protein CML98_05010 [Rhodobiaceae bacterium]|nr:hypothetical protein [Rhodobiaceae bacterium]|tara:strand:- start:62565 stop:63341 length:777 start_codon:yes stop_codon:yes gene_type:complete